VRVNVAGDKDLLLRTVVRRLDASMVDVLCTSSSTDSTSQNSATSSPAKFKAALKKKTSAGKQVTGGSGTVTLNDAIIALQVLLPSGSPSDLQSLSQKLQIASKPNLVTASASAGKLLGLSSADDSYYFCSGAEAVEKTRLVFEQWMEQT
jgi:hypothetical protein